MIKENFTLFLKDNANSSCWFFSNLAESLQQKLSRQKYKFGIKITEENYKQIRDKCEYFALHNVEVTEVDRILKT